MILHRATLISEDIFENEFVCNLSKCKGICCVEGDYGAPLTEKELGLIEDNLRQIKPYMTDAGRALLDNEGFYEEDPDGDLVTTCVKGRDCVFAVNEDGIYKCAVEKAHEAGASNFRKPASCHLYPVRLHTVGDYTAVNYSRWDICSDACTLGKELKVPVYKFLKNALTAYFGAEWYSELELIAKEYQKAKLD